MELCPNCHRKLISQASARCNWCGHLIDDPQYQENAAANRQAFYAQAAIHDAQSLAWQLNSPGAGPFGDPIFGLPASAKAALAQQVAEEAAQLAAIRARRQVQDSPPPTQPTKPATDDETDQEKPAGDRYGHLEIE